MSVKLQHWHSNWSQLVLWTNCFCSSAYRQLWQVFFLEQNTAERHTEVDHWQLAMLVYWCLHCLAPSYLADDLQLVADLESRQRLCSLPLDALVVPPTHLCTFGDQALPVFHLRNDLYCVGWGVKLHSLTSKPFQFQLLASGADCRHTSHHRRR